MIVSCGEALVDLVPDPVPGGGPMNAAVTVARQGVPSAFVGRISDDAHGDLIWRHLEANGVDLRCAQRGPEPTARAIVEHDPVLRFRFEGENTADTALTGVELGRLGAGPHIVHGGTLGLFRGSTADVLAELVERHDGLVSLDPNVRPALIDDERRWRHYHERWLRRTHIYRGSDEDLEWIWPGRTAESIAEELLAGAAVVFIVTRGERGAEGYTSEGRVAAAGREVEVIDTVGAGDTFAGTILAELWRLEAVGGRHRLAELELGDWDSILERAVTAAALTCTRRGADPPTRAEVDALLPRGAS